MPSIIARLTERQERDALLASIGEAGALHQIQRDRAAIEATVQTTVANWRALLTESVIDGRQLLREVLMEPPQFEREGRTIGSGAGRASANRSPVWLYLPMQRPQKDRRPSA